MATSASSAVAFDDDRGTIPHSSIVLPGQVLAASSAAAGTTDAADLLRGHGTYRERVLRKGEDGDVDDDDNDDSGVSVLKDRLVASVAGLVERVDRLRQVRPLAAAVYRGVVGDVVVGRVSAVGAASWRLALSGTQRAARLPLAGVHLPGGVQRLRTAEDARAMRVFLREGDLVSAEVHRVQPDGTLLLQTRSHRYGRLENGCLVLVPPALVARRRNHYATLLGCFDVIWGCNGMIWIQRWLPGESQAETIGSPGQLELAEQQERRRQEHADMPYATEDRQNLARLRNCIECLRLTHALVTDEAVEAIYHASLDRNLAPAQILLPANVMSLMAVTRSG